MSRLQSDSGSSDNSMDHPPRMKSTVSSSKRPLEELPEILVDVNCLRDEFIKLYEEDYPKLLLCIEKLHKIIKTFEEDFRCATKGTRDGGAVGIAGSVGMVAGIVGLVLAPVTAGASLAVAGAVTGVGAGLAVGGGVYGGIKSSEKKSKMKQIREDIEAELEEFQNKINPFSEKIKRINERIEEILKDLDKLERDAIGVSEHYASISGRYNIRREHLTALNAQMNITVRLIGTIVGIFSSVGLLLDLLSVIENSRTLNDIDYLAEKSINEHIDKSAMKTKAGEFIVGMRNVVYKLQNIMDEINKTKDNVEANFRSNKHHH